MTLKGKLHPIMSKLFDKSSVVVSYDEYLLDLYHSDVLIKLPYVTSAQRVDHFIINIEVQKYGKFDIKRNKLFLKERDEHLKSQNVFVARIELPLWNNMNDKDIEEWIMNTMAHAVNDIDVSN